MVTCIRPAYDQASQQSSMDWGGHPWGAPSSWGAIDMMTAGGKSYLQGGFLVGFHAYVDGLISKSTQGALFGAKGSFFLKKRT